MPMLAATLLTVPAAIQPADPLADAWLVQVKPGAKLYFFDDVEGAKPRPSRAYVVAGDMLVASGTSGGFTSVTFVTPTGRTRGGWLDSAGLVRIAAGKNWQGVWKAWESEIEVAPGRIRGTLHIEGSATWGAHDPQRVAIGGVHVGEFAVDAQGSGDRIAFSVDEGAESGTMARGFDDAPEETYRCRVQLRLLGPYLLARDNGVCGGANVSFTGTYRLSGRR
ncbi:hypothetical protein [Sphingomonas psychrotolerans]|uniref:Uncharacterized protein n=1 Tax=Sphingomonas psychrotolerans TaxID=1327635 RepID=A0A2K8MMS6_9SPHN|nr:hypothetical protein [Sphingomonas psychrotolerans]ATY33189.1 hypothetical protein CVN68_15455 [Sphingomonas psychrotolerans]